MRSGKHFDQLAKPAAMMRQPKRVIDVHDHPRTIECKYSPLQVYRGRFEKVNQVACSCAVKNLVVSGGESTMRPQIRGNAPSDAAG